MSHSYLIAHGNTCVPPSVVEQYNHGLQQLAAGRPLAYVIGQQGFWRLYEFLVDQSTLIPRVHDTEILVETVLQLTKNSLSKPKKILDLGTGSGCIAISLAAELAKSHITAVDNLFASTTNCDAKCKQGGGNKPRFFTRALVSAH